MNGVTLISWFSSRSSPAVSRILAAMASVLFGRECAARTNGDTATRIFLRADKSVGYGDLMQVMNLLRGAGYLKVALVGLEGADTPAAIAPAGTQP